MEKETEGYQGNQLVHISNNITTANSSSTFSNHIIKDEESVNHSSALDSSPDLEDDLLSSSHLHQNTIDEDNNLSSLKSTIHADLKFIFNLNDNEDSDSEFDYKMKLKVRYEFLNTSILENKIIMKQDYTKFIKGRLITILKKKKGCVLMHRALLNCSKETLDLIYKEVLTQLESLICDNYVTYFIELLFCVLKKEYIEIMLKKILLELQGNLNNKAVVGFVISILSQKLPTELSQLLIDFVGNNIEGLLSGQISFHLLITIVIRFDATQLARILPRIIQNIPSLINSPNGWNLSLAVLETHKDSKTQNMIATVLACNFTSVANSESGYKFLAKMIREFKSNQAWKYNHFTIKQKIKDNLWIIMNNRWVSTQLKWKKLEDSMHYKNIDLEKTGLFKAVIKYVCFNKPDNYLHFVELLIESYQSAFVNELIQKLKYNTKILVEILCFDPSLSIFNLILKVCKLEELTELYRLLCSVNLMSKLNSNSSYSELLSKYSLRINEYLMHQEQTINFKVHGQNKFTSNLKPIPNYFNIQNVPINLTASTKNPFSSTSINRIHMPNHNSATAILLPNAYCQFVYLNHI